MMLSSTKPMCITQTIPFTLNCRGIVYQPDKDLEFYFDDENSWVAGERVPHDCGNPHLHRYLPPILVHGGGTSEEGEAVQSIVRS